MLDVIEPVAAFHAQAVGIRRTVFSLDVQDPVVLDVVGELAADTAIRANRIYLFVGNGHAHSPSRHQRARWTRLDAFPARHAGGIAHWVVKVEDDLGASAAEGIANHVVHLFFPAGAHATLALDARVQVHRYRGMRQILGWLVSRRESWFADAQLLGPEIEFRVERIGSLGHIGKQQLDRNLLAQHSPRAVGDDFHAIFRIAAAGGRQNTLAFNLHHASPAVAIGPQTVLVAQARNLDPVARCRLE